MVKVANKSTAGAQGAFSAYMDANMSKAGTIIDDKYRTINSTNHFFVPKGAYSAAWCENTGNIACRTRYKLFDWNTVSAKAGADLNTQVNMYGTCWANCPSGFTPTSQV
jgi:hypothetical protein